MDVFVHHLLGGRGWKGQCPSRPGHGCTFLEAAKNKALHVAVGEPTLSLLVGGCGGQ